MEVLGVDGWSHDSFRSLVDDNSETIQVQNDTPVAMLAKGQALTTAASMLVADIQRGSCRRCVAQEKN